jgi:hypothetical protein
MDEITVFAVLRPEVTELSDAERAGIRARLLAGSGPAVPPRPVAAPTTQNAGTQNPGTQNPATQSPARRPARARRLALAGVGAVAAAVTAAALVILPGSGTARPVAGGPHPSSSPAAPGRSGPAPSRPAPVAVPATASAVFLLAARAAAATPDLKPGPGQFIYVEQLIEGEDYYRITKQSSRLIRVPPYQERDWLSADGHRGLLRTQRYLSGGRWVTTYHQAVLCPPGPARQMCLPGYLTGLPTTARGMRRYLLGTQGPNGTVAYRILNGISGTSWETGMLVPNRSYALMFRMAAKVPGIRLVPGVVDVAGRPGIAVAACVPAVINKGSMPGFHGCPERDELIFDARTYELIGEYQVAAKGRPPQPGSPSTALLRIAVVSRLGQLP